MSLTRYTADLINERRSGTVDDLMPECEGYSRDQVIKALNNAAAVGLISCDGRGPRRKGPGGKGTTQPATFRAIERRYERMVSSVFQLGAMQ